ncbi:MAG: hypothetical protein LBQ50_01420, partial [Planctomycetaceae bacterium]|nr:hypothetical protein [Planctomycetaceae bacterium]
VSVNVLEGIGEIRRAVKTHNLFVLLTFSGLRESFEIQAETKPDFEKIRTLLFEVWTEQSRYNAVGTTQQNEIKQIIEYLGSQTEGILQWIRKS